MTLREETIRLLRSRGKTEEEIDAHMAKIDAFMSFLAERAPTTVDLRTGTTINTATALDFDEQARDA